YAGIQTPIEESHIISSTSLGNRGEDAATKYLMKKGFIIVERNWKTKACEIDIVAKKGSTLHFVEVKYRATAQQGGGIAAITPTKLKQMNRAVRFWFQKYGESNAKLSCVEVTGHDFTITNFVEQV
ncbi:MAG: YraN family protein, partial [Candidatus Saccharimonadales bacterium]